MLRRPSLSLALVLLAAPASAQESETPPPGADEYTQQVQRGIAAAVSGDSSGALEAFRRAVSTDGSRPMAPYYVATLQRMGGNLDEALTGFQRAAELARSANAPAWRARALQGVAMTLERMEGRLQDALAAWQEYVRFADANSTVAHPQLGRARVQAINIVVEQEAAYVTVRERIAEREAAQAEESSSSTRRRRRRRQR